MQRSRQDDRLKKRISNPQRSESDRTLKGHDVPNRGNYCEVTESRNDEETDNFKNRMWEND